MVKLYMGGSPCTHWSIAQTKNRETTAEGLGWELFKNYLIGLDKFNPDYFFYENNKSMAPAIREQITKELGVEPIMINSALVSAQNRQRLYWTNIPGVTQPQDKGIMLVDVLESGLAWREKSYTLDASYYKTLGQIGFDSQAGRRKMVAEPVSVLNINPSGNGMNGAVMRTEGKSRTLTTNKGEGPKIIEPVCVAQRGRYSDTGNRSQKSGGQIEQHYEAREDGKTNTITTVQKDNMVAEPVRIGTIESDAKNKDFDSQQYRVYSPYGKSVTLCGNGGGVGAKTGLYAIPTSIEWLDGKTYPVYEVVNGHITIKGKTYPIKLPDGCYIIRKLTVTECKRLQTVPDDYIFPVSNSQAYKMLGNGWTVDVIAHILSHAPRILTEPVEVLSMYDGMSCGRIALNKLGADVTRYHATEIDKYAIQTTQFNFPDTIQLGDAFQVREAGWSI